MVKIRSFLDLKSLFFTFFAFHTRRTPHDGLFFQNRKKNYFGRQKSTFYPYEHHYWPKLTQIWPKFGHIWLYQARSTGVQKNFRQKFWKKNFFYYFFSKIEKNIFRTNKIHIFPLWTPLWLPSPHTSKKF